jgi:hypothetical protein
LYDGTLSDDAALEAAWTLFWRDALSCDGVEDHSWDASAAGGTATAGWAGEVHVEAGGLAISALIPYLIDGADLVFGAIVLAAQPLSSIA